MESIGIKSVEDAIAFDKLMDDYQKNNDVQILKYLSMESVYKCLPVMQEPGQVSSFLQDLKIQFVFLNCDNCKMSDLQNEYKKMNTANERFMNRTELLKINSNFILRYRATWDKVMAILVLILNPDQFKKFYQGNSRKKKFKTIFSQNKAIPDYMLQHILKTTKDFDEKYRTKEAHQNGSAIKFTYSDVVGPFSDQSNMSWAWNALLEVIVLIDSVFLEYCKKIKS